MTLKKLFKTKVQLFAAVAWLLVFIVMTYVTYDQVALAKNCTSFDKRHFRNVISR